MRINEDYLDNISNNDLETADVILNRQLKDRILCQRIDEIIKNKIILEVEEIPDFSDNNDAIYPVDNDRFDILMWSLHKCFLHNMNLNWIDTSKVTSMHNLFDNGDGNGRASRLLNVDISRWDVSNVIDMSYMFFNKKFRGDISKWDVSSVINMESMFNHSDFNSDISKWDVSSVKYASYMFSSSKYNRNLSRWDLSSADDTKHIFDMSPMEDKREWWPKGLL